MNSSESENLHLPETCSWKIEKPYSGPCAPHDQDSSFFMIYPRLPSFACSSAIFYLDHPCLCPAIGSAALPCSSRSTTENYPLPFGCCSPRNTPSAPGALLAARPHLQAHTPLDRHILSFLCGLFFNGLFTARPCLCFCNRQLDCSCSAHSPQTLERLPRNARTALYALACNAS